MSTFRRVIFFIFLELLFCTAIFVRTILYILPVSIGIAFLRVHCFCVRTKTYNFCLCRLVMLFNLLLQRHEIYYNNCTIYSSRASIILFYSIAVKRRVHIASNIQLAEKTFFYAISTWKPYIAETIKKEKRYYTLYSNDNDIIYYNNIV